MLDKTICTVGQTHSIRNRRGHEINFFLKISNLVQKFKWLQKPCHTSGKHEMVAVSMFCFDSFSTYCSTFWSRGLIETFELWVNVDLKLLTFETVVLASHITVAPVLRY